MRPIDADALIEILAAMQGRCDSKTALIHNSKIWNQVKEMPTIDAVPVTRCRDCKWYGDGYLCYNTETLGMQPDDYCSLAERREK